MTLVEQLATFVHEADYQSISALSLQQLKVHILDSLGCAIGASQSTLIKKLRAHTEDFGGSPLATLIGGGKTAPDRAAFYNGALVRYLDYNDSFLARGETCHPSDNLAAVLAACEYANRHGKDLLLALAVAYQVQGRLSEVAPVRASGFDHTTQGAYAAAAGVASALGLSTKQIAHAIAISGTANNALRVTRTGALSNWKGLAYPNTALAATHAAFLAMRGITGPLEVFEGNKGFMDAIANRFELNWQNENLDLIQRCIIKKYNAEIHSQSALEGILDLQSAHTLLAQDIERIEIDIFDVSYNIIGGGEEGDKRHVASKEEADHSLPYMVAVALLDGEVTPAQYAQERIQRPDVQALLRKVIIQQAADLSARFPQHMPCRIHVFLHNGQQYSIEKQDYEGFHTRPMSWETVTAKFTRLSAPFVDQKRLQTVVQMVEQLETLDVRTLTEQLARISTVPA